MFEESLALADSTGYPELRWTAREPFEFALWQVGDLAAALRMNDEQIALGEVDPNLGIAMLGFSTANSFSHRGLILGDLGRFHESKEAFRRCDERARRFGDNEIVSWNETFSALMLSNSGDVRAALSTARRGIEWSERIGSVLGRVLAHGSYGMALLLNAEWEAARQSLALVRRTGARSYEPQIYVERARLAALASDSASRLAWLRAAQRLFLEMGATGHAERTAALPAEATR